MKSFVVAGIGTDVGKTFISAILVEALKADYWKPVQAGNLDNTDTDVVKDLLRNSKSVIHPSVYNLTRPMSPHAAAEIDNVQIEISKLNPPATNNTLIIEPAGGLMVPLNKRHLIIDLLKQWNLPVILISQNYLGSINHTLLSVEALRSRSIPLLGIIFNGQSNPQTEEFILNYTKAKCLARIAQEKAVNKNSVKHYADQFAQTFLSI